MKIQSRGVPGQDAVGGTQGVDRSPGSQETVGADPLMPQTVRLGAAQAQTRTRVGAAAVDARLGVEPGLFDLRRGMKGVEALPKVLRRMTPENATAAMNAIGGIFARVTGQAPPAAVAGGDPTRLLDLLAVSAEQLARGVDALLAGHRAGMIEDAAPKTRHLPDGGFDLGQLGAMRLPVPQTAPKPIAEGLWQGDLPSDLPVEKATHNQAFAEIFDRLANNATVEPGDRWSVDFAGGTYTRLETFLDALEASGHAIEATFEHRVANFANLKTQGADGQWLDVPACLMVKTGVVDDGGEEAVVPASHAEMVLRIRGPEFDADVKFYQGMNQTGFFPCDLTKPVEWAGGATVGPKLEGAEARRAVHMAGLLSDVIQEAAVTQGLPFSGYGYTGVCMDSVQVVLQAMGGPQTYFPLLMRDPALLGILEGREENAPRTDGPEYRTLAEAIRLSPSDAEANAPEVAARALASLPWGLGMETFKKCFDSRSILMAAARG